MDPCEFDAFVAESTPALDVTTYRGNQRACGSTVPGKIRSPDLSEAKNSLFPAILVFGRFSETDRILRLSQKMNCFLMKKEEFIFKSIEIMRGKREECLIRAKIRESFRNGEKVEKIAEDFKIHRATVYRIIQESNGTPKKRG